MTTWKEYMEQQNAYAERFPQHIANLARDEGVQCEHAGHTITRQECRSCGKERTMLHVRGCPEEGTGAMKGYRDVVRDDQCVSVTYIRYPVQVTEEMVEKALDAYRGVTKPRIDAQRMRDALETALKVLLP